MNVDDGDLFDYSDIEKDDDDETLQIAESFSSPSSCILVNMLESYDWAAALSHITLHPTACRAVHNERRTPLHLACHHDAPAVVIQALLKAYPDASVATGTSNMNPLHITCSSRHASAHVVRVLHELGRTEQFSMRDIDGDTPLHAACRCGASTAVLNVLLRAYPSAVMIRDYEGLTPLLRLWVRYFVILGADTIKCVTSQADLVGELLEAWNKTELLLQTGHSVDGGTVLHAAAFVDGPRPVVRIAAALYKQALNQRDAHGRTPLMVACQAPIYPVRDLSDAGYRDVLHGEDAELEQESQLGEEPSVIGLLLQANQGYASLGACWTDPSGRLPLHMALASGKEWQAGVSELVEAFPESLSVRDQSSQLLPFQIAALHAQELTTVFTLIRNAPTVVVRQRSKKSKKHSSTKTAAGVTRERKKRAAAA